MGRKRDILDRLAERLARGEISEKTYLSIKERYEKEGFPDEEPEPRESEFVIDVGQIIRRAVAGIPPVPPAPPVPPVPGFRGRHAGHAGHPGVPVSGGDYTGEDYTVTGVGAVDGNLRAKKVNVVGVCKVEGDCVADDYQVTGTCKVEGNLSVKSTTCNGVLKVEGDAVMERYTNRGMSKVEGNLRASTEFTNSGVLKVSGDILSKVIANSGTCKVTGDVRSDTEIVHSGVLKVGGDVAGEAFQSSGVFAVDGAIRANRIAIELSEDSRAEALEGGDIRVTARGRGLLQVERVQGHTVHLEATLCESVEGDDVEIGPSCRIEQVVAKRLKVHEGSEVRERRVTGG
jgi:cytoskeletal protein CcmA (bactofilin family)